MLIEDLGRPTAQSCHRRPPVTVICTLKRQKETVFIDEYVQLRRGASARQEVEQYAP